MVIRRPSARPSLLQRSIQIGSRPPLATDSSIRNGRGSPDRVPHRRRQPPLSGPLSPPFSFPSSFPVFLSLIWSSLSPRGHPAPPTLSCHGWRSPNPATLERRRPFPASRRCAVIAGSASLPSPMAPPRLCLLFLCIERCDFVRVDLLRSSAREH